MRVCFLLGGLTSSGGIGRVTSVLANQLAECKDIDCCLLSYYDAKRENVYAISDKVEQSFLFPAYCSMTKCMTQGGPGRLRVFLQNNAIDIIVACGALFFPVSVRAVKGTRIRCICWEHTSPASGADHRFQGLARRYGISKSDMNVVLTKSAVRMYVENFGCRNTLQIYNPIDQSVLERASAYQRDSKRIISVGRLTYQKNFSLAVEAASRVLPAFPGWTWDIYGEGEEREQLERLIQKKGLYGRVRLRGEVDNLYDLYQDYSFAVMTSRYEGFPMSLLEGLGNGLPLISFDIATGPDEIITSGENGFLVEAGNVDMLAERMREMMLDSEKREQMSRKSRKRIPDFSMANFVNKWAALLAMM
ncbi:MAG: glycosyltransferase family 4 protein [Oscillibacter sp.]|nr:glycosyltransferase family 4 protein [Oscillibacter sp.]